ncbi:MAG: hypothetical protein M3N97_16090 [Pseudomonadota bacterium]|nr:hypothetical protein [Pseudomonadota bacterium]
MTRIAVPNSPARRRSSSRGGRWLVLLLLVLVIGGGLWAWLTLSWAYSDGERAGVLQKFSRKGWVCKTQEGELAQYVVAGISPQIWQFSVRDPTVARQLDKAVGHRVQVHYTEHPGVPSSCFADTRYFVDRVTITDDQPGSPSAPGLGSAPRSVPDSGPGGTVAPPPKP